MNQYVKLTFSLKYLVNFTKSSTLCDVSQLMMSNCVPLLVSTICWSFYHATLTPSKYHRSSRRPKSRSYMAPRIGH